MLQSIMPPRKGDPITSHRAQPSRNDLTGSAARLWTHLRAHRLEGVHVRRKHTVGNYIVDFFAPRSKLIIEIDRSLHQDHEMQDTARTTYL